MEKAIAAVEKGMGGAFLQTGAAQTLRQLAQRDQDSFDDDDRQQLLSFLGASSSASYAPQSVQITGILKQMHETMSKGLADSTATEESAIKSHEELMAAKHKEVEALSEAIESKMKLIGELGVEIVQMKEDLDDTQASLAADNKFLAELETSCKTKTAEWEERSKTRAEELVALADTIKVLNDDDALELFKHTLPSASASASFVEVSVSQANMRALALATIKKGLKKAVRADRPQLDLIALALHGKKIGFDKVVAMIDKMVDTLKVEQGDDDHKKEYCEGQLDSTDDKHKALERKVSDHETAMAS